MRRRALSLALVATALTACLSLTACGGPDKLSKPDARKLAAARESLDDALDTEETLRTSREEAKRLHAKVRAIVARGAFEKKPLDEFGLAALGELRDLVPSLVLVDDEDSVRALDQPALDAFLRYAESDARRATIAPATRQVALIERTVKDSRAGGDTRVPPADRSAPADQKMSDYLGGVEHDLKPAWPALAARVSKLHDGL